MKKLVAFFSASGTTKQVANNLATAIDADVFEIAPKQKYTTEDLNYMNKKSRSTLEMQDKNSRPEIEHKSLDISKYDVIFLGFPIWWYTAPRIINTFLESYNFANKTIVLFATSGGSGLGNIAKDLKPSCNETTNIISGKILNGNPSKQELKSWAESFKF